VSETRVENLCALGQSILTLRMSGLMVGKPKFGEPTPAFPVGSLPDLNSVNRVIQARTKSGSCFRLLHYKIHRQFSS